MSLVELRFVFVSRTVALSTVSRRNQFETTSKVVTCMENVQCRDCLAELRLCLLEATSWQFVCIICMLVSYSN